MMRTRLLAALAGAALVVGALGGAAASGEVIQLGNLVLEVDGGFSPKRLPKKEMAPIKLEAEAHIATNDGSPPPVADRVVIDFDKQGTLDTKGLARCDPRKLENTLTRTAKRKCKDALVGKGKTKALVDFPDQDPFVATGPLLAFNGKPKAGNPVIVFHVFAHVPAPTTFVVPAVISNAPGSKFGKRVEARIPVIAGGNGTLTDVEIKVKRKWRHKGEKHSYLIAKCAKGHFLVDGEVTWADGNRLKVSIVRPCKTKKAR